VSAMNCTDEQAFFAGTRGCSHRCDKERQQGINVRDLSGAYVASMLCYLCVRAGPQLTQTVLEHDS
jgi:hypothetical protein